MLTTPNYGLKKPEYNNVADVYPAVCDNMDILDLELKKISNGSSTIYPTTNIGNRYFATIPSFALQEGFPFALKFNAPSSGNITININNGGDKNVFDYFNNRVNNVRTNLIANFRYDSINSNFQLLGKGGGGNVTADKMLNGVTATGDNGSVVGNIPSKATATYNPSTIAQTIASGQYLSGVQTISATTGTATVADVVAGKTFNSASGIAQTGIATIETLGGRKVATGIVAQNGSLITCTRTNGNTVAINYVNVTGLSFKPSFIYLKFYDSTSKYTYYTVYEEISGDYYPKTVKVSSVTGISDSINPLTIHFKGDVSPISIINGGFTLPIQVAGTYTYIAFE